MSHPTIQASLSDLVASLVTTGTSLVQAAVALFHLVLAFGHFWLDKFVQFAQTCIQLGFELFRGVAGFVVGMSGLSGLKGAPQCANTVFFGSQFLRIIDFWRRLLLVAYSVPESEL